MSVWAESAELRSGVWGLGSAGGERKPYPSDLPDEHWSLIEPVSTACEDRHRSVGDHQGAYDIREIANAILYLRRPRLPMCLPPAQRGPAPPLTLVLVSPCVRSWPGRSLWPRPQNGPPTPPTPPELPVRLGARVHEPGRPRPHTGRWRSHPGASPGVHVRKACAPSTPRRRHARPADFRDAATASPSPDGNPKRHQRVELVRPTTPPTLPAGP